MLAAKVTRGWIDSRHLGDVRVQALGVCTQSVMSTVVIRSNQQDDGLETIRFAVTVHSSIGRVCARHLDCKVVGIMLLRRYFHYSSSVQSLVVRG